LTEALDIFKLVRRDLGEPIVDYHIGNALSGLERYEDAIEKYEEAINTLDDDELKARAWTNMGNAHIALNRESEGINAFAKALEIDERKWQAYLSWGEVEFKRHDDYAFAVRLYRNAIYLNPQIEQINVQANYDLAYCLWKIGENREAYHYVNNVLEMNPEHKDAQNFKAYLLVDLWRQDESFIFDAIQFYKALSIDNPDDKLPSHMLFTIYQSEGYKKRASLVLNQTSKSDNIPAFVCYDYAMFLQSEGNLHEAIEWLGKAVQQSHEHAFVHQYAHLQFKIGEYRTALKYYKLAAIDCSNPENVLISISDCYHLLQEYESCLIILMKLLRKQSKDADIWTKICYSLVKLNRRSLLPSDKFMSQIQTGQILDNGEYEYQFDLMVNHLQQDFGSNFVERIDSELLTE